MKANLKQLIEGMIPRARVLNGLAPDGGDLAAHVATQLTKMAAGVDDVETAKQAAKLYIDAQTDPAKMRELQELRVEQTNNYILATANFLRLFFRVVSLGPADRPVFQNNTMQEVSVGYVGEEGGVKRIKVVRPQAETLVDLRLITSKEVNYRLMDLYNGDVKGAALATIDIGYDMAQKEDALAHALLTASVANGGAYGSFTFTGNKASRVYLPHSRINTTNLPTTNDVPVPGSSGSTKFRFEVLQEIGRYAAQWAGCFPDGDLVATGTVLVPAKDIWDLATAVTPTGQTSNAIADKLMRDGAVSVEYMGTRWTFVADNTIASGVCYAQYNKPVGEVYTKSVWNKEFVKTNEEENIESRRQQKAFGAYIPSPWRIRTARFTYTT